MIQQNSKRKKKKIATAFIYIILIFAIIVLIFIAKSMFFPSEAINQATSQSTTQTSTMDRISLTPYDKELARQMMDKDGDGKCDVCGMPVEMCIDSGQLQCNMDSKSTIGVLGSAHIHADFKVYINGEEINFAQEKYFVKSRFMHIENDVQGDTGKVLHMHATGVPLWIFFNSIEMKLPDSIKVYVNNQLNSQGLDYVFNDLDKILITDGKEDLQNQLDSITSFSRNH